MANALCTLLMQVKTVAENIGTAEAVRHVAGSIRTEHFVLLSSDLVTDMPLRVLIAAHFIRGSVVSCLLYPRRTSPSAETKPGKAPKNVDYVGASVCRTEGAEAGRSYDSLLGAWP